MHFRHVFIAVFLGTSMVMGALFINQNRSRSETTHPSAELVRATGKCAECHRNETAAIVHQFEMSAHAKVGVNCLNCHQPVEGQTAIEHRGFQISQKVTSKQCSQCHTTEYNQFLKSRHGAPAWAAVRGDQDFTQEQIEYAEKYHPGAVKRSANILALKQGPGTISKGCMGCHSIGKPNQDGSIGTCTECHSRHSTSVALAREPSTCGQCHMGPDHSQIEIFNESKHGVLFAAQKNRLHLNAPPKKLTTKDMPVPTCATCHMSGLDGQKITHDTTDRLSYWLFSAISEKRPTYTQGQDNMKETCLKCHASTHVEKFYREAEIVLKTTNQKVSEAQDLMNALYQENLLTSEPFDEPIEFIYFDLWHYYGRTAKHGAFMGGADFVQWHGDYELLLKYTEMKKIASELRESKKHE